MRKQMDELGKLLRDQQALRDDTFRSDQRDRGRRRAQRRASPPGQDEQAQPDDDGPTTSIRASPTPSPAGRPIPADSSSGNASTRCATASPNCSACSRASA